jgi:hypothetical protein
VIPLTAQDIAFIAKTGGIEVASAGWQVVAWVIVVLFVLAYLGLVAFYVLSEFRGSWPYRYEKPMHGSQASVDAAHERLLEAERRFAGPAERPSCPWCDTHECIDRTMCNCAAACGSWLCEAKEEKRYA